MPPIISLEALSSRQSKCPCKAFCDHEISKEKKEKMWKGGEQIQLRCLDRFLLFISFSFGSYGEGLFRQGDLGELEADFCTPSEMLTTSMTAMQLYWTEWDSNAIWLAKAAPRRW